MRQVQVVLRGGIAAEPRFPALPGNQFSVLNLASSPSSETVEPRAWLGVSGGREEIAPGQVHTPKDKSLISTIESGATGGEFL